MCNSPQFWCDGTFKTAPKLFYQLFTIHAAVFDHVYPLVYCLMTGKTQDMYTTLFRHLSEHASAFGLTLNPFRVICDFELAIINSIYEIFPNVTIGGCLFHYTQAVYRYAVTHCGLKVAYKENQAVNDAVNYLLALPFVPLPQILQVFDELQDESLPEEVVPLYLYVERTWYRGVPARGRRRAVAPRYRPELWNQYVATISRIARTNNYSEAWNAKFTKQIMTHHANLWKFIDFLKRDQRDNELLMVQLSGGHRNVKHPIRPSFLENQRFIEAIVGNYPDYESRNDIRTYLKAIAYRIKRPAVEKDEEEQDQEDEER